MVGETADATGLLLAVAEKAADLVLLDWELPGLPAEQSVRLFLKIIAMSSRPEVERLLKAVRVQPYLSKGDSPERVPAIIRALVWTKTAEKFPTNLRFPFQPVKSTACTR